MNEGLGELRVSKTLFYFLSSLIGWDTAYNYEWWFFKTYCFSLIIGCIYLSLFSNKKNLYLELFAIIIFQIFTTTFFLDLSNVEVFDNLNSNILYQNIFTINGSCSSFLMGILFAKYNVSIKWYQNIASLRKEIKIIESILLVVVLMFVRQFVFGEQLDFILCILIIFAGKCISNEFSLCRKILLSVGKYSSFMWLTHSFYCYYFYGVVKFVNISKNMFVTYLTLFLLTYFTAFLLECIYKYIKRILLAVFFVNNSENTKSISR